MLDEHGIVVIKLKVILSSAATILDNHSLWDSIFLAINLFLQMNVT